MQQERGFPLLQFNTEGTSQPCQMICCAWDSPDLWPGGHVHLFLPCVQQVKLLYWEFKGFACTQLSFLVPLSPEGVILTCLLRTHLIQHKSDRLLTSAQVEINPLWTRAYNCFFSWVNSFKKGAWRKVLPCLLKAARCTAGAPWRQPPSAPGCPSERHGLRSPHLAGHSPYHNPLPEGQQNVLLHHSLVRGWGSKTGGQPGEEVGNTEVYPDFCTPKSLACIPLFLHLFLSDLTFPIQGRGSLST